VRRFARENGLALAFGAMFLVALGFQALTGWREFNNDQVAHAQLLHQQADTISFARYLTSSNFGQAVMENWQSEYLQFSLFILGTVWLVQRGSPESKELHKAGLESEATSRSAHAPAGSRLGGRARAGCARSCTPTRCCS
jgi:hypothetical protein